MQIAAHGGLCCGITHIHGFPAYSEEALAELRRHIDNIQGGRRSGIIEVVLIDNQMTPVEVVRPYGGREHRMGGWNEALAELGFRIVSCAQNSNHGNWCNVLHLRYGQPAHKRPRPFEWRPRIRGARNAENGNRDQ